MLYLKYCHGYEMHIFHFYVYAVFLSLVMNISAEKLDKLLPFLILVLNEPGCCPLPEELHEAAFHLEPDVAGQIEEEGEKS